MQVGAINVQGLMVCAQVSLIMEADLLVIKVVKSVGLNMVSDNKLKCSTYDIYVFS